MQYALNVLEVNVVALKMPSSQTDAQLGQTLETTNSFE